MPTTRLNPHDPNSLQLVPLAWTYPSEENCRLFVERDSLEKLIGLYRQYDAGEEVILPDAPILRFRGWRGVISRGYEDGQEPLLEIIAGERRVTAARAAGVQQLPCRVVTLAPEESYRFILAHNDVERITTAELAFRAAEMDRLGFDEEEIADALGGHVGLHRYLTVGRMIRSEWFSDDAKKCDPGISEWYEATLFGHLHFKTCFANWNSGRWDASRCSREFRNRGKVLPVDNAEKGFRVTYDMNRLVVRGQLDLDLYDDDSAELILDELVHTIHNAKMCLWNNGHFGVRTVYLLNGETVGEVPEPDEL